MTLFTGSRCCNLCILPHSNKFIAFVLVKYIYYQVPSALLGSMESHLWRTPDLLMRFLFRVDKTTRTSILYPNKFEFIEMSKFLQFLIVFFQFYYRMCCALGSKYDICRSRETMNLRQAWAVFFVFFLMRSAAAHAASPLPL